MSATHTDEARAEREAADWFAKLNSLSITTRALEDFQRWRQSPANDAAYERMEALWQVGGRLKGDPDTRRDVAAALARGARRRRFGVLWSARARTAYGVAALAAGALVAVTFVLGQGDTYSTGVGEQRLVSLQDGTRIRLDTDTRLRVKFSDRGRDVRLEQGQAFFNVAHDAARPFVVKADQTAIRALGTRFDVRLVDADVKVTLVQGAVEVTSAKSDAAWRLRPGQSISTEGAAPTPRPVDVATATSWTSGRLTFRSMPLAQAVAEVNRYSRDKVVVDAERLKSVPVSGVFDVGDTEAFVVAVCDLFELQAERQHGEIRLTPIT